ncbi:spore germination protein [Brevibacillus fluminis]|uniref:spore germination protein n=1 Tax=Brevibacillus fluminis TaxID=511487 RepID=UPI003F8B60F1
MLTNDLAANVEQVMQVIGHNPDVIYREMLLGESNIRAALIYSKYLVNKDILATAVIRPLLEHSFQTQTPSMDVVDEVRLRVLQLGEIMHSTTIDDCISGILAGSAALLIDGADRVLMMGICAPEARNVTEPITESAVRGSREGFVENLETNLTLLRKQIKNPFFTIVPYIIGRQSRRNLALLYLSNIANPRLIEEVKQRLGRIDIDDAQESGIIEQLIEDDHWSPFPQIQNTERPDKVNSALMEGRVAILLDGTPFALLAPVTLNMLLQTIEDYSERWYSGLLLRLLRYMVLVFALFLPSLYIALVSYHQGLIPTKLAISMAESREGVPFPTLIEALIMETTIEILREAGIRLPKPIGQAVGIVGGLVIGQSAVQAGIVSPIMVIVVALTAISSFAIPQYSEAIALRILRFGMMLASAFLGLYGIVLAFLLIAGHIAGLKSFGVNYAGTFAHYQFSDLKDTFFKAPQYVMKLRPKILGTLDRRRSSNGRKGS